jgi:hypothetical protein
MDEAKRMFLNVAGIAEPVNVIAVQLGNELGWFQSQSALIRWARSLRGDVVQVIGHRVKSRKREA